MSYQKYSRLAEIPISYITCDHEFDDAFLCSELRPGLKLILYNKDKNDSRMKHTLWHEIGHIKCGHTSHGNGQEVEANFFAAQANAPNILIRELHERGYPPTPKLLVDCFGLSNEAAQKKMKYLATHKYSHKNEFDDVILTQFQSYLNTKYPAKGRAYYDSYDDEMEKERQNWY